MPTLLGILIGAVLLGSIASVVHRSGSDENQPQPAAATVPSVTHTAQPLGNDVTDYGPLSLSGTAIMDFSTGKPPVPYIKYESADGDVRTKQLVYLDSRPCAPGAADLPCSPGYPQHAAYPQLVTGSRITVYGYIRDNRFLVEELSVGG
jgi:hypothetical protein